MSGLRIGVISKLASPIEVLVRQRKYGTRAVKFVNTNYVSMRFSFA